ncbi:hypothetical protein VITU9109_15088 [Vibrio tubiashii ATCC 19109]|uniref:Alcohol dehydrogenase n=1 Tax=Vibrio tubiashii ATCC 19109 TaxID=1051646 RepID=A0ABN0DE79_9VIBR|nr:hypothetical protein VITU9109_15088 [Vibrio tubiashii ATCC 19109]
MKLIFATECKDIGAIHFELGYRAPFLKIETGHKLIEFNAPNQ